MDLQDQILAKARGGKRREVPEWGGLAVLLCGLPASLRLEIGRRKKAGTLDEEQLAKEALRHGLRDPDKEGQPPIFTDQGIDRLLENDAQGVTDKLLREILEESGIDKDAIEAAKRRFFESPSDEQSTSSPIDSDELSLSSSPDDPDLSPASS